MQNFMSELGTLADEPTPYWDHYETSAQPQGPLDPGLYVLTVPQVGDDFKPGKTRPDASGKSYFQYEMNPIVSFPADQKGKQLKFQRFSVKKSPIRSGSLAGDLIVTTGVDAQPKTASEWLGTMPSLVGQEFGVQLDLNVWDKDAGKSLYDSSAAMPKDANGKIKTRFVFKNGVQIQNPEDERKAVELKNAGGPEAAGIKVLYANNRLVRILPADEVRKLRA